LPVIDRFGFAIVPEKTTLTSLKSEYSIAAHWPGDFDDDGLRDWAKNLRAQLNSAEVTLGLVFMSPKFFPHAKQVLEILRVHAQIPLLAGCSGSRLIAAEHEIESSSGLVLALYSLPGAKLKGVYFTQQTLDEAEGEDFWQAETGIARNKANGWLAFIDPFHLDAEGWLRSWSQSYHQHPVFGGLASGAFPEPYTQVYLNGDVYEEGGVAVAVGGEVELLGVISQGCTPIGESWILTRVHQNYIQQIASRPAYSVLAETVEKLSPEDQHKTEGNLFIGLVVNEYLEDFHRGDFLVRNLLGADKNSGVLAVAALPRTGQTVQFHRRDPAAATQDMDELLARAREKLAGRTVYGSCLCSCNGRGVDFFNEPDHDASMVQKQLGPFGQAGFFCNGELGPIGDKNFLHSYTASLALFVKK
jgi:small ligand-binding sensory domain FIST